jgi:tripartite-type tricarboxylate transporter receptor subunit TctC
MIIKYLVAAMALVGWFHARPAPAQDAWPAKPVKIIVNFAPGGSTDNSTRPYADRLSRALGQQFVIENKAGASGTIGIEAAVRSAPDGYTFIATGSPVVAIIPQARKLPWDSFRDLAPVAHIADYLLPIAVHPSLPVTSLKELQAYAKNNPGKLNCGSSGLGTLTHVICESLNRYAGIDNLHVPYRGGADALNDFLAGIMQIHSEPNVLPHVKAGKARLIAVADRQRHPDYPDVPTITEIYPNISAVGWFGLFAPAGTPQPILRKLNEEMRKIAALPEIKAQFQGLALRPGTGSPEDLGALLKTDWERYGALIKELNLRLD